MTAIVTSLTGKATVLSKDGVARALREGDELQQGDIVITASGSSVGIQSDGDASFAIPENNEFLINDELFGVGVAGSEAEVMDATVATLLEAVEAGSDLLEGLEAPGAGAIANNGHTFVRLGRILFDLQERGLELGEGTDAQLKPLIDSLEALALLPEPEPEP